MEHRRQHQLLRRRLNYQFTSSRGLARVALGALFIGTVFGIGVAFVVTQFNTLGQFGLYMIVMAIFHWAEFFLTALFHPGDLEFSSFLLDHSWEYGIMFAISQLEFFLELSMFPELKQHKSLYFGIVLCVLGQAVRWTAMVTAAQNFTHIISDKRKSNHELVTNGVYALMRHPSYAGWFWWSIGTQILLGNPVCAVLYSLTSWYFFKERIEYEEKRLRQFFGDDYDDYCARVLSGVPFVS